MNTVLEIIRRKPPVFLFVSLGYLIFVGFLKWHIRPPVGALWFLAGGAIGVYFLDTAEVFFALDPSPFRNHLFAGAFAIVSLFILTSSGSLVAQGLVFSLAATLTLRQFGQMRNFWLYSAALIIETFLFIAWA